MATTPPSTYSDWLASLKRSLKQSNKAHNAAAPPSLTRSHSENNAATSNESRRSRQRLGSLRGEGTRGLDSAIEGLARDDPLREAFEVLFREKGSLCLLKQHMPKEDILAYERLCEESDAIEDEASLNRMAEMAGGWDKMHQISTALPSSSVRVNDSATETLKSRRDALAEQVSEARRECKDLEDALKGAEKLYDSAGELVAAKDIDSTMIDFHKYFSAIFPEESSIQVPLHLATSPKIKEYLDYERRISAEMSNAFRSGMRQDEGFSWEKCKLHDMILMEEPVTSQDSRLHEIKRLEVSIAEAHRQKCLADTALAQAESVRDAAKICLDAGPSDVGDVQLFAFGLRPSQELRHELARLDEELQSLMNSSELQEACLTLGKSAVSRAEAMHEAILAARNRYFYDNYADILEACAEQQRRLKLVREELMREYSRFGEFVVSGVTRIGKVYEDLVSSARSRMELYREMLNETIEHDKRSNPVLEMLVGSSESPLPKQCAPFVTGKGAQRIGGEVSSEARALEYLENMRAILAKSEADTVSVTKTFEAKTSRMKKGRDVLMQEGLGECAVFKDNAMKDTCAERVGGLSELTPHDSRRKIEELILSKNELEARFRQVSSGKISSNAYWRKESEVWTAWQTSDERAGNSKDSFSLDRVEHHDDSKIAEKGSLATTEDGIATNVTTSS